jgi:hypothetical protein
MDANEDLAVTSAIGSVMTSNHFNPIAPAPTRANPNTGVVSPGMAAQIGENIGNLEMNDFHAAAAPDWPAGRSHRRPLHPCGSQHE